jgi:plasmid stabilization system protein ParE
VRLTPAAQRDLRDAARWYESHSHSEDVAARFRAEVDRSLKALEQFPSTGGFVPGAHDSAVRRVPVNNFPYHIIFVQLPTMISVVAIAHDRRAPYWVK